VNTKTKYTQLTLLLIAIYVVFFGFISYLKFESFAYHDFDLAVHDQVMWNILHGSIFSSILGVDFLGNHMHLISFLIIPIYKLFPHPLTLLFLQTMVLGFAAWPLYLLARSVLDDKWAMTIAFMFLIFPALGYTNLFEYHPTVFATMFLSFMLYYFHRENFRMFLLFVSLAMLCQENIPLVIIAMGFLALLRRRRFKWIFFPIIMGGVYFWLCVGKLIPYFNQNKIQFISIYGHLGDSYSGIIMNILRNPIEIIKLMFTKEKIIYLTQLFGPISFIALLSPLSLLAALPLFMQHLLSLRLTEVSIYYHYTAEIIPFIFFALVYGIKNLLKFSWLKKRQFVIAVVLVLVSISYNFYLGPHFKLFKNFSQFFKKDGLDRHKEALLRKIPEEAAVVAAFEFLPRLTHREQLYSFHHLYMGYHTLSERPYELPDNINYALLDFNDIFTFKSFYRPNNYENIRQFLNKNNLMASDVRDTLVLFQKESKDKHSLYYLLHKRPKPENKVSLVIDQDIELLGYDLKEEKHKGPLHITFYWHSLNKTQKDINLFFDIVDDKGRIAFRILRPICYRIYPTQAWQPGQFIVEEKYLIFPYDFPTGKSLLKLGFFDYGTGKSCQVKTRDPLGRINIAEIKK